MLIVIKNTEALQRNKNVFPLCVKFVGELPEFIHT
jgi:hypothetical protein